MDNHIYPAPGAGPTPAASAPISNTPGPARKAPAPRPTQKKLKWKMACRVDDVPRDGGACVSLNDEQIAVFNFSHRGQWFATQNECPHKQQMALSRGMIGSAGTESEPKLACPFHKKTFSLLSGECLSGDPFRINTYPVKIRDGKVYVGMEK